LDRAASVPKRGRVIPLETLNGLPRADFVAHLGGIYEHSPWVAERAFAARPFASLDALHAAMERSLHGASGDKQLALIRAHPELMGKLEAAQLTGSSRAEQASAGLDRCTAAQRARMQELNAAYREKFGFPFIVAVKGLDWAGIIERIEARLRHAREAELATALQEIGRIARFRLEALAE
jgi:2-oxo-4-hydroxy-4-carboxy-5-ureidoimidazoline decarboxylase